MAKLIQSGRPTTEEENWLDRVIERAKKLRNDDLARNRMSLERMGEQADEKSSQLVKKQAKQIDGIIEALEQQKIRA